MTVYNPEQKAKLKAKGLPILKDNQFIPLVHKSGLKLTRKPAEILQINIGKLCNLTCKHCHVEAGPKRKEVMSPETFAQCMEAGRVLGVKTIDLTGGAPEMLPNFREALRESSKLAEHVIVRSNLTILVEPGYEDIPELFRELGVHVVASLPCYSKQNVDEQRGNGVFEASIEALKKLNSLGYGKNLQLDLVYNPGGPTLPPPQKALEQDYKTLLQEEFGVTFNRLLTITNMPIGRFYSSLKKKGQAGEYIDLLIENFNPETVPELMCRNTVNVSWDGWIYDCDFNQMLEMPLKKGSKPVHISEINSADHLLDFNIKTATHCLGCTAGAGSSCGGELT